MTITRFRHRISLAREVNRNIYQNKSLTLLTTHLSITYPFIFSLLLTIDQRTHIKKLGGRTPVERIRWIMERRHISSWTITVSHTQTIPCTYIRFRYLYLREVMRKHKYSCARRMYTYRAHNVSLKEKYIILATAYSIKVYLSIILKFSISRWENHILFYPNTSKLIHSRWLLRGRSQLCHTSKRDEQMVIVSIIRTLENLVSCLIEWAKC